METHGVFTHLGAGGAAGKYGPGANVPVGPLID